LARNTTKVGEGAILKIAAKSILVVCHAIPYALTVSRAFEQTGQPFLLDHQHLPRLTGSRIGPIHLVGCYKEVTEAQARRLLGFPDTTIVVAPFGVYVADDVQKIQLIFVKQCRDDTSTRHGTQRLFDWLDQTHEDQNLVSRAASRKKIIKAIASEL
jgi:hypothetical protein